MGVFNNWPYTNTHELNLDWVLEQVRNAATKSDLQEVQKEIDALRAALDDFISDPATLAAIQQAVTDYLDELVQQGVLSDLIYNTIKNSILDLSFKDTGISDDGQNIIRTYAPEKTDIDEITLGGLTLRQIFEDPASNVFDNSPLDSGGFPLFNGTAMTPSHATRITVSSAMTYIHDNSVRINTTSTAAYMQGATYTLNPQHVWFVGCKYMCVADRAGTNNATGFKNIPFAQSTDGAGMADNQVNVRWFPRLITNKWMTYAAIGSYEGSSTTNVTPMFGTFSATNNYVGYYADMFTYVNLSALWPGGIPDYSAIKFAFNLYLNIRKNGSDAKNEALNGSMVPSIAAPYTSGQLMTMFYREMSYKAIDINMVTGWKQFYSASGWNDQEANSNKLTATQLLKLGMAFAGDPRVSRFGSTRTHRINCFGNRGFTKNLLNDYIETPRAGNYLTNPPVFGKGGSLPSPASGMADGAEIRDFFVIVPIRPSSQHREILMALAVMGLDRNNDNRWNVIRDCTGIGNDLANGNTPDVPGDYSYLNTLITRASNPISVALMIMDRPADLYTCETWNDLTTDPRTLHWETANADSQEYIAASTIKMLTALTAIDMISDLYRLETCIDADIQPGSGNCILPSDMVNYEDLLYLAIMNSDNDAANMLARCSMLDYCNRIYTR